MSDPLSMPRHNTPTDGLTHPLGTEPMITIPFSYRVGGSLAWNDPAYIKRAADNELLNAIEQGKFAYVLGPRQIGKSSLRIQTRHRLAQQGYRCVTLQASQLRSPSQSLDTLNDHTEQAENRSKDQECSALISSLWSDLGLSQITSLRTWLKATLALPTQTRLARFSNEFLTDELRKTPIVIFIDEIDALLEVPFLADLLQWIEQCDRLSKTAGPHQSAFKNLNFVILGTTTVCALSQQAPAGSAIAQLFSNGVQIAPEPFNLLEVFAFARGFEDKIDDPTVLLKAIFYWTQGQPFLTQKICHIASNLVDTLIRPAYGPIKLSSQTIKHWIDNLVRSHIIQNWALQDTPIHFRAIRDRLIYSPHHKALLSLYKAIYQGTPVPKNNTQLQAELLLTGIVSSANEHLQITNPIYHEVFSVKATY